MARSVLWLLACLAAVLAPGVNATPPVEMLISDAGQRDDEGKILIELRFLNGGTEPQTVFLPDRIEARVTSDGALRTIWLERTADLPKNVTVPPDSFRRATYRFQNPADASIDGASIAIPAWSARQVTIAMRVASPAQIARAGAAPPRPVVKSPPGIAPPPSDRSPGNPFLTNLSAYEPIYAVYGPGTNSDARIQISFKYQLFGTRRAEGLPRSWRDGLHFAYTQRMFWDLGANSSPFRNVDYQPELVYLTPSATMSNGISVSAQGGIRHESNGRDGTASRSVNSFYVAPMAAIALGDGYRLSVAPRLSLFVGSRSDNPDIRRYRGNTGLFVEVGADDGLRLSTSTRFNLGAGKGALSADLSYPLPRLLGGGPDLFLFGQSFVGYGENLLDYDRRMTRFRIGVAFVR
ncbi:outer membrane phospholipase A [Sphingomonas sp. BE270]|jgi:phospholipase A1|uniref:phospholipase A n=1 Tax=Sphingomonas sp. BE270 TaxID=2817726 RepID=UPI002863D865|nr:phospholipase A [Sphingomonas sp. BE270]MDR7256435.1 outer membrane phospholipase A [Sphingomonas sp. BE270]